MKKKIIFFIGVIILIFIISYGIFFLSNIFQSTTLDLTKSNDAIPEEGTNKIIPVPNRYYDVVRVIDGDTIVVDINGKKETVRALGMNSPETVDPKKPVECFGSEASLEAKKLLENKKVKLQIDPNQSLFDKYDRLLAYIWSDDGIFFDEYMIANGFAFEYTYQGVAYKYQKDFKNRETSARSSELGLWAKETCGGKFQKA